MNFFFLDRDPKKCARYHGDRHLNKMQVESAQILSFVWHRLVFDRLDQVREAFTDNMEKLDEIKANIYKRTKSHLNHPVVKWAAESRAHYQTILQLGLALGDEKRRRIEHMATLPPDQRRPWKLENDSEAVLRFLALHVPPLALFPQGDDWTDPPKCMPAYLHTDENGDPLSVVQSYRLFYAGNKVTIAHLRWEPYVETPDFLGECQDYIRSRPDIQQGIQDDLLADLRKKFRQPAKRQKREIDY